MLNAEQAPMDTHSKSPENPKVGSERKKAEFEVRCYQCKEGRRLKGHFSMTAIRFEA